MGQYYRCLTQDKEGKMTIYSLQIKDWNKPEEDYKRYNGVKLMEHSWVGNSFMNSLSALIYKNPLQIAWVGDYASDFAWGSGREFKPNPEWLWHTAWETEKEEDIEKKGFDYKDKFLVNHTLQDYLDLNKYMRRADKDGWKVHPLSLLTACGNGLGGGDYWEDYSDSWCVGDWCWDEISIEDEIPEGYNPAYYTFREV